MQMHNPLAFTHPAQLLPVPAGDEIVLLDLPGKIGHDRRVGMHLVVVETERNVLQKASMCGSR